MNKAHFQALLDMGYSALEALDILNESTPSPEPEPAPATEPEPTPEPAPEPETKPEESADPMDSIREEMKVFQEDMKNLQESVSKSIQELTRSIQRNNIRTMGTDENPEENRAEEFLAQLIKGGK